MLLVRFRNWHSLEEWSAVSLRQVTRQTHILVLGRGVVLYWLGASNGIVYQEKFVTFVLSSGHMRMFSFSDELMSRQRPPIPIRLVTTFVLL